MAVPADLILANRAYADHNEPPGPGSVVAGAGGLVAAVGSAIAPWDGTDGTLWVGAGRGSHDRDHVDGRGFEVLQTSRGGILHQRLFFSDEQWTGHYEAVSNSFLWPALHLVRDALSERARFFPAPLVPSAADWRAYESVNDAFAAAAVASDRKTAWVHDYQLALVPARLRERGFSRPIGFFLHTPFPKLDRVVAAVSPEGLTHFRKFVEGILGADVAGFQTQRDCDNFCETAVRLCGASHLATGLNVSGRTVQVTAFPVGVNAEDVRSAEVVSMPPIVHEARGRGLNLVVALERADFTKGIPARLEAVADAYRAGARFAYVGSASPTREGIALYEGFESVIQSAAERAGDAAKEAGCPFAQQAAALAWNEVVALLREADVVFTSSLSDGMNLVPLQAAIAQEARSPRGVVIAGQDAGVAQAYAEFVGEGVLVVDPLDSKGMVSALLRALSGEVPGMSDRFVAAVRDRDAAHWAAEFMTALEGVHA